MMDAGRHPRITLHMQAEVTALDGRPGRFRARLRTAPRYVDPELCVGCGLCAEACPATRPNPFDLGLKTARAIDRPFPQAVPNWPVIDVDSCIYFQRGKCKACEKFCPTNAIDFEQKDEYLDVEVGNVSLYGFGLRHSISQYMGPTAPVEDVSLGLGEGEFVALLGASGCGKSTTAYTALRYLPGNARVTGGRVAASGIDLMGMSAKDNGPIDFISNPQIESPQEIAQRSVKPCAYERKSFFRLPC